jgi:hypothetical protein
MLRYSLLILLTVMALAGCRGKAAEQAAPTSEPVSVNVRVDRPQVRVGDLVKYTISVNAQTNIAVVMPDFAENLAPLGSLLIHDWDNLPEEKLPGGRVLRTQTYELETYLTGVYEIPPARVSFLLNGHTNTLYSSALCVEVVSIAKEGEMTDIRDVKGVVELMLKESNRTKIIIVLCSLAAAALVLLICLRKNKEKAAPPPVPAHVKAFAALEALASGDLLEKGLYKEYFSRLSDILRYYIEDRFSLRAPEQTTEEFLAVLRQSPEFSYEQREMLRSFLSECDMIKFAKGETSRELAGTAAENVRNFVEQTKEQPENNAEKEGGKL